MRCRRCGNENLRRFNWDDGVPDGWVRGQTVNGKIFRAHMCQVCRASQVSVQFVIEKGWLELLDEMGTTTNAKPIAGSWQPPSMRDLSPSRTAALVV